MKMNMNNEIKKYQGQIYFYDRVEHTINSANWIESIDDYNHNSYELHHVVPYTDWEKNTKDVRVKVGHNALILLPKVMHQHLENPVYKLSKSDFEKYYDIHPDEILFDINSRLPREKELFISQLFKRNWQGNSSSQTVSSLPFSLTLDDLTMEDIEILPEEQYA